MNALLLIDLQNDFLPSGALAVPHGDDILPIINQLIPRFDLVIASQDWHPAHHASFASNHPHHKPYDQITLHGLPQTLWPDHCVQGTPGADLASQLPTQRIETLFRKGTAPAIDSYSAFFDNGHRKSTGLAGYLRERQVTELYLCGLATDYCVYFSALDALAQGFTTHLLPDATRGVNLTPTDSTRALDDLRAKGAHIVPTDALRL